MAREVRPMPQRVEKFLKGAGDISLQLLPVQLIVLIKNIIMYKARTSTVPHGTLPPVGPRPVFTCSGYRGWVQKICDIEINRW